MLKIHDEWCCGLTRTNGNESQRDFFVDGAGEQDGLLLDVLQLCHDRISPLI